MMPYSRRQSVKSLRPAQTAKALTLVEMLVVVFIAGLIAAVAIPLSAGQSGFELEGAARRIMADARYAQSQSMNQRQGHSLVFDTGRGFYFYALPAAPSLAGIDPISKKDYLILFGDACTDPVLSAQSHAAEFPAVELDSVDFGGASTLCFDELGFPVDAAGAALSVATIDIRIGQSSRTITVDVSSGQVTIN